MAQIEKIERLASEIALRELYLNDRGFLEIDADWDDNNQPQEFIDLKKKYLEYFLEELK